MTIRTDGIRTITDLRDRCIVDEDAPNGQRCWVWGGAYSANGQPCLWLPALGRRVTLGVAACVLRTGKPPAAGVVWHCTCTTPSCANPFHRAPGNRSTQMRAAGIKRDAVTRARIAASKRAQSRLTPDDVNAIRASSEPLRVVAERHGISTSYASLIRRGERWPHGHLQGFSVFTAGGAA